MEIVDLKCIGNDDLRYFWRIRGRKNAIFILLNPSKTNAKVFDQTTLKCIACSKLIGCDGVCMLNVIPYYATKFDQISEYDSSKLLRNSKCIRRVLRSTSNSDVLILGWGDVNDKPQAKMYAIMIVDEILEGRIRAYNLINGNNAGLTKSGHPRHPSFMHSFRNIEEINLIEYKNRLTADQPDGAGVSQVVAQGGNSA
jgi:hypothetical protein